ncbi:uncharacterized protein N7459_005914 [Penicillium hispanicum]|uniref:uncharacterized protein n=1 Tax=Penicillium hispanicum TaxID=1080232 RepID=UPI002540F1D0|nr:uncharacterized protein N7459_005914 [Penicillium hispanicum]KAJ5579929.1 hypothetical protein N7459_005914 [Penicillium hispanicum]
MHASAYPPVRPRRRPRSTLTWGVACFLAICLVRLLSSHSEQAQPAPIHASAHFLDQNLPLAQPCPSQIFDHDYSPAAIRCRIESALERARLLANQTSQSSTPEEAVAEYRRRYQRNPPSGFQQWVQFAQEHGSQVIDDFDQIDRDLEPYRTPEGRRVLRTIKEQQVEYHRTKRITITNGSMSSTWGYMYDSEWRRLVDPFLHHLPDSLFFLSTIDEPRILSTSGPPPDFISFDDRGGESVEDLVKDSCSQLPRKLTSRLGHEKDVCQFDNPGDLHALIASPNSFLYTHSLLPMMSFGRMSAFRDILIPCPCYAAHPFSEDDVPFLDKKPGLYWRGSSTGGRAGQFTWRSGHRERFVMFMQSLQKAASALDAGQYFGSKADNVDKKQVKLFKDSIDVHMGAYIQCDDEACKDMQRIIGESDIESEDTASNYRYLFDIDGNTMSTRFYRLLSQQAVVLKETWFHEWHDDRLIPWAHYIPITMSMEEIPAVMNFLVNDPDGERLSAEIAHFGSTWSRKVLREVDMSIYLYRLMLELAELARLADLPDDA